MTTKPKESAKKQQKTYLFDPNAIELKWQSKWEKEKLYQPDLNTAKKPFYNLMMFPYPSAEGLHVGSFFTYGGIDAFGRFKRLQGYDVFEPIGLDGFGIHSENYALKVGRTPKDHAAISEENFYKQLHTLGNMFDWSRKLETYDADYYRWTQWLFVELFKSGLAYKDMAKVNFCPSCKTVLADEQVIDGKCERCGTVVEKKDLAQWFFRITHYAERLAKNLETLDWSHKVKLSQKNWIGKSEGAEINFNVVDSEVSITTFTTRPDTLYGATFLAVSPEHPLVTSWIENKEVASYVAEAKKKSEQDRQDAEKEKTGVFSGAYVINPINNEHLPIWIADYVLMGYGTGAIMAVPAHDERDYAFAKKYDLPIREVIAGGNTDSEAYSGSGKLINSGSWNGLVMPDEKEKILEDVIRNGFGKKIATYHLRDWLISRQRYWAAPIPMIFCTHCAEDGKSWFDTEEGKKQKKILPPHQSAAGWYPEENLPVLLPEIAEYQPLGTGKAPLANYPDFFETICPHCKRKATRETDVCDTFLDSSWYFLRYLATDLSSLPFPMKSAKGKFFKGAKKDDLEAAEKRMPWLPIVSYIGGAEHSVLHLLYSRFITMVLFDQGYLSFEEPFTQFRHNGLIIKDGAKMSKSKGNVINPDEYVKKFGADTLRVYLGFVGPFSEGGDFRDSGIEGTHRFLKRVWTLISTQTFTGTEIDAIAKRQMHEAIHGITGDMEALRFNTAIAKIMTWYNTLSDRKDMVREEAETFLTLLAPFAPHMTEELWQKLGNTDSVHNSTWPLAMPEFLVKNTATVAIQINGKLRDTISVSVDDGEADVVAKAQEQEKIKTMLANAVIKKIIYVQGKIVNFVI